MPGWRTAELFRNYLGFTICLREWRRVQVDRYFMSGENVLWGDKIVNQST